ncbi:hypothetical protein GSI_11423 [Ganoderma sinense ZZ0214-1]|uniref:Uncharacterized protein n=1 Tax=Ganoderma sinense ZZ0214-1 TaxID=1077348 RepID=A0A2G8RVY8_9APHY|nr:hypothetical protein GSI_11423 [Ganoderma sinense ZZ0214-1]
MPGPHLSGLSQGGSAGASADLQAGLTNPDHAAAPVDTELGGNTFLGLLSGNTENPGHMFMNMHAGGFGGGIPGLDMWPYTASMQTPPASALVQPVAQAVLRQEVMPYLTRIVEELHREVHHAIATKLSEFRKEVEEMLSQATAEALAKVKDEGQERNANLTLAVHYYTIELIGCPTKTVKGPTGRLYYDLPAPLADDEEPRMAVDGTRLWNPDWAVDVNVGINAQFIRAVVDIVLQNGPFTHDIDIDTVSRETVELYVRVYFRNLKAQYKARATVEGQQKLEVTSKKHARLQRKKRKAARMRKALEAFKAAHGLENTVGVEMLCHTDWQSSEHSDIGEATEGEWTEHRDRAHAGAQGVEVRRLVWRSEKLNRIYAHLRVLAKTVVSESAQRRGRFRGPRINYNTEVPRQKRRRVASQGTTPHFQVDKPYKECVSAKWAGSTANGEAILEGAPDAPTGWTIFNLVIPDDALEADDLGWVADIDDTAM